MTYCLSRNSAIWVSPSEWAAARCLDPLSGAGGTHIATGGNTTTVTNGSCADTWVEGVIEFVDCTNEELNGLRTTVVKRATTTITLEDTLPASVTAGDTFRLYENPKTIMVHDGAGTSTTDLIDSSHSESDDVFNGLYARCIYAAGSIVVGESKQISDWANATTKATCGAFSANIADGDVFEIGYWVLGEDIDFTTPQEMIDRSPNRNNWSPSTTVPGVKRPSASFSLPLKGNASAPADTVDWVTKARNAAMLLFRAAMGSVTDDASQADVGSSSTTVLNVVNNKGAEFTAGNCVLVEGAVRYISSIDVSGDPDALTVTPALGVAPVATQLISASKMMRMVSDGSNYPVTLVYWEDQTRYTAWAGCPQPALSVEAGQRVMVAWSFPGAQSWDRFDVTCPTTIDDSLFPEVLVSDLIARNSPVLYKGGSAIEARNVTINFGIEIDERQDMSLPEGSRSAFLAPSVPTIEISGRPKENSTIEMYRDQGTTGDLLIQFGSKAGEVIWFYWPKVQVIDTVRDRSAAIVRHSVTFRAVVPATADNLDDASRMGFA